VHNLATHLGEAATHMWCDIGAELSLGLFVLLIVGAMILTFLLST
jgi:hypothetical protein